MLGLLPLQNYWGSNESCSPFFLYLTVKSNLLTQKFSNILQLLGLCPRPHCTLRLPFFPKNSLHIAKSYALSLIVLIVFDQFLPSPNQKIVSAPILRSQKKFGVCTRHFTDILHYNTTILVNTLLYCCYCFFFGRLPPNY